MLLRRKMFKSKLRVWDFDLSSGKKNNFDEKLNGTDYKPNLTLARDIRIVEMTIGVKNLKVIG